MAGIPEATPIVLTADEQAELEELTRSTKTEYRLRQRAQIVLLAAKGVASRAIGRKVGCTTGTASKWRVRYARDRLAGLDETGDRGAEPKYTAETNKRILAVLDRPVPAGHGRWTGPLIAAELGDVDVQYVWRFLRAQKIDLAARKSWCESNDPQFAAKAAEIVGLYLDPPDGALVLAVDEKPSIQALERAQGYLKLPNGRALTGHSHDYKRHGTTTLFAALDIATGEVRTKHYGRRRRIEFLDFMTSWPRIPSGKFTSSSTTSTPISRRPTAGSPAIPTSTFISRRRAPPGSIRSRFGSRSWPISRSPAPPLLRSHNCEPISMPSSRPIMSTPNHLPGPNPRSARNASKYVSLTNDSGY